MKQISIRNVSILFLIKICIFVPSVFAGEDNLVFPEQISDLQRLKVTRGNNPYSQGTVGVSYGKRGIMKLLVSYTPKKDFPGTSPYSFLEARSAVFRKQYPSAEIITPPWRALGCNEPTGFQNVHCFRVSKGNSHYEEVLYSTEIAEYLVYVRVTYTSQQDSVRYMADQLHSVLIELELPLICSQLENKEVKS